MYDPKAVRARTITTVPARGPVTGRNSGVRSTSPAARRPTSHQPVRYAERRARTLRRQHECREVTNVVQDGFHGGGARRAPLPRQLPGDVRGFVNRVEEPAADAPAPGRR